MPNYFDYISESAERYDEPEFIEESVNDSFNETIADMDLYCFQESLLVAGAVVSIAALIGLIIALVKKMIDVFSNSSKSIDKKMKNLEREGVTSIEVNNSVNNNVSTENGIKYVNVKSIEYVDFTKGFAHGVKERINNLFENTTYYLNLVINTGESGLAKISEKMKKMSPEGNDNFVTYLIKDNKVHHEGEGIRFGQSLFVGDVVDKWVGDYRKCISTTDKISLGTLHACNRDTKEFIADLKKNQRDLSKLKKEVEGRSRTDAYNSNVNHLMNKPVFSKNMSKITAWYTNIEKVNNKLESLL